MTVPTFPGCGAITYNDFTLPATFQASLNATAVYDEDNLRLKYFSNVLNVSFILTKEMVPDSLISVTSGVDLGTVDNYVAAVRQILQEPRKELEINYQGLGFKTATIGPPRYLYTAFPGAGITTSNGPNLADVAGGPLPRTFNVEPIGSSHAVRITWSVEFFTVRCLHSKEAANGQYKNDGLIATVSDHRFSINEEGLTSVTISGYYEFAYAVGDSTRPNNFRVIDINTLKVNITNLDTRIREYHKENYSCTKQEIYLSRNKKRIEYSLTFEERPSQNPIFPYTIKVDARHRVSSSLYNKDKLAGSGFFSWDNTISVNVTIAPGFYQSLAYAVFLWILNQRYGRIGTDRIINPDNTSEQYPNSQGEYIKPKNILLSLEMEENIYTRTHSFKAQYLGIYRLSRFFQQSGLFTSIRVVKDAAGKFPWEAGYVYPYQFVKSEWKLWRFNTGSKVQQLGGYDQLSLNNTAVLFDPCDSRSADDYFVQTNPIPEQGALAYYDPVGEDKDPESSYVNYEVDFQIIENTRNYQIGIQEYSENTEKYLNTLPDEMAVNRASSGEGDKLYLNGKSGSGATKPTAIESVAGNSTYTLVMTGSAVRYKKQIPVPAVYGVISGGEFVPVKRIGEPVVRTKKLSPGDSSLHAATWQIAYSIPYNLQGSIVFSDGNKNEIETGGRMITATPPVTPT